MVQNSWTFVRIHASIACTLPQRGLRILFTARGRNGLMYFLPPVRPENAIRPGCDTSRDIGPGYAEVVGDRVTRSEAWQNKSDE